MKIAILGLAKQGRSAYEYWREDNEITVCDGNAVSWNCRRRASGGWGRTI